MGALLTSRVHASFGPHHDEETDPSRHRSEARPEGRHAQVEAVRSVSPDATSSAAPTMKQSGTSEAVDRPTPPRAGSVTEVPPSPCWPRSCGYSCRPAVGGSAPRRHAHGPRQLQGVGPTRVALVRLGSARVRMAGPIRGTLPAPATSMGPARKARENCQPPRFGRPPPQPAG